ncbi:hypothetical protein LOTGIDRAFT_153016 [Lottia gigantea]|uniref:Uncharacterized protein n=1 Tax=Lottia gigantea TaxID=225164 RepID=V4A248_LOTGI|nr:hypothetical protein LOTGIDRAFT_153016 [Lottia gigantea]ESO97908.1 hypothetical protein LOTGIDRAFT_153016 [Lottia gigantea]
MSGATVEINGIDTESKRSDKKCRYCGRSHSKKSRQECPADSTTCSACGRKRSQHQRKRNVFNISANRHTVEQDMELFTFHAITISSMCLQGDMETEALTTLDIQLEDRRGNHKLKSKVDTGAAANTLPLRKFCDMYPRRIKTDDSITHNSPFIKLRVYNGTEIPCHGGIWINCKTGNCD